MRRARRRECRLARVTRPYSPATGELRFETVGAVTLRLSARRRARLSIAGRTVALEITVSAAPPPR